MPSSSKPGATGDETGPEEPFEVPIDGVLDLHTFRPADVKLIVPEYLILCRERKILRVRVIHGKGIGNLRRTVHAILGRLPEVASFALASGPFGGWGATIVHLKPPDGGSTDLKMGLTRRSELREAQSPSGPRTRDLIRGSRIIRPNDG